MTLVGANEVSHQKL